MRFIFSFFFIMLSLVPAAAKAQTFKMEMEMTPEEYSKTQPEDSCTKPLGDAVDTEPHPGFCDIRARVLAYHDKNAEMRQQLEERRKKYEAPREEAVKAYKSNLQALYKRVSTTSP